MAITVVSSAVPGGNPTTSFTVTIPTVAVDDVLVLAATNRGATTNPTVTDNDTGGNTWTLFGGTGTGVSLWWKRATSATSAKTITASGFTNSSSGVLRVFRGCRLGTPYENVSTVESNASGDETNAGITPTRNGCWVCLVVSNRTNDEATTTHAATSPASLSTFTEKLSTGGLDCSTGFASAGQSTAGATGNITWAQTNAASLSIVFDMVPAWDAIVAATTTFTITGRASTFNRTGIAATTTFALTGQNATFSKGRVMAADTATFALAGQASTFNRDIVAATTTYALTGQNATLSHGFVMVAEQAAPGQDYGFNVTGRNATFSVGRSVVADTTTFTLTGQDAALQHATTVAADTTSFALTGQNAGLTHGYATPADTTTFTISGQDATFAKGRTMTAAAASFALAASVAPLLWGHVLNADAAALAMTGQDATLTYTPVGSELAADTAAFALTGNEATFQRTHNPLAADVTTFTLTGNAATFSVAVAEPRTVPRRTNLALKSRRLGDRRKLYG